MDAAIETHDLTKRFGDVIAVDHINLAVRAGEFFGVLGPNGAGKTTLVRMLAGLLPISEGEARVAGIDVERDPDGVRAVLGVVPQALTSDKELTGAENMDIYARYFDVPRALRAERVQELLRRTGLWERRDDLVSTYSGGMRRRLEIARGLIHKPKVLFLDEPTIGLDPQSRRVIWDMLRDLRKGETLTISLTTHYLDEADALCDRVAIVDAGQVVALGSPEELKANVPGSDTITIGLAKPATKETLDQLRALPGVRTADVVDATLTMRVDRGSELLPRVLAILGPVHSATIERISLEDVFIHFTGRSLRDEGGRRGENKE